MQRHLLRHKAAPARTSEPRSSVGARTRLVALLLLATMFGLPSVDAYAIAERRERVVTTSASLAQTAPLDVYQRYIEAYERGDVAAIVSLFADDGVFVGGGGCRPTPCVGKAAIQRAYESQLTGNYRLTVLDRQVAGDTISWRATLVNDATSAAGVARIVTTGTAEVRAGKIASLRGLPDPSDAETATFVAWQVAQPPAMPAALPRAGDAETPSWWSLLLLALVGAALVGAGTWQVRSAMMLQGSHAGARFWSR